MDFLSVMPEEKSFPAAFVVVLTVTGTCVGEYPHPPFVRIRENPEFHGLLNVDYQLPDEQQKSTARQGGPGTESNKAQRSRLRFPLGGSK